MLSFVVFIYLDYLINNNYLGITIKNYYLKFLRFSFLNKIIIICCLAFLFLTLFSCFDLYLINLDDYPKLFDNDLYNHMSNSGDGKSNSGVHDNTVNGTINLNHPKLNVSVPAAPINNLAGALSVSGGGALALKVMQQVPGGPGVKVAAGLGTMLTAQALTIGMGKILNANSTNNENKTQKLIDLTKTDSFNNELPNQEVINNNLDTISNLTDKLNDFPLNLIPEINQLVTAELLFLFIILNVFIAQYISKLDYNKYIPDNRLGKILKFFISRYINIWSKSIQFLLIVG